MNYRNPYECLAPKNKKYLDLCLDDRKRISMHVSKMCLRKRFFLLFECNTFRSFTEVQHHFIDTHSTEKESAGKSSNDCHRCSICGDNTIMGLEALEKHMKLHDADGEKISWLLTSSYTLESLFTDPYFLNFWSSKLKPCKLLKCYVLTFKYQNVYYLHNFLWSCTIWILENLH